MLGQKELGLRLKALREARRYSMRALASRANVAVSFVSKIENGIASPTLSTLVRILEALGLSVPEFFASAYEEARDVIITAKDEMQTLDDGERRWRYLFKHHPNVKALMTYEEYRPGTEGKEPESHPADLMGLVLEGVLTLEFADGRKMEVKDGDSFYIRAGTVHTSSNKGKSHLAMTVVELPLATPQPLQRKPRKCPSKP